MFLHTYIYDQVESLPNQYLNNSCFILTDHDLQIIQDELSMFLDFDFEKPLKPGTFFGFPCYLD